MCHSQTHDPFEFIAQIANMTYMEFKMNQTLEYVSILWNIISFLIYSVKLNKYVLVTLILTILISWTKFDLTLWIIIQNDIQIICLLLTYYLPSFNKLCIYCN